MRPAAMTEAELRAAIAERQRIARRTHGTDRCGYDRITTRMRVEMLRRAAVGSAQRISLVPAGQESGAPPRVASRPGTARSAGTAGPGSPTGIVAPMPHSAPITDDYGE